MLQQFAPSAVTVVEDGRTPVVTTGADDPQVLVLYLAMVGVTSKYSGPPEVTDAARRGLGAAGARG